MDAAGAMARSNEAEAAAHARLMHDTSIQFALPDYQPPTLPAWLKPLAALLRAIEPAMPYLFWAAVIGGAALILFLIARELWGLTIGVRRRNVLEEEDGDDWRPDAAAARVLLSEADALAASGDHEGAVHLLLRRSVADIAERLPRFLSPSLTARDIAVAEELPAGPRAAFATIAAVTEAAVFAKTPIGESGWRRAREAYETFALGTAWRARSASSSARLAAA